MPYSVRWELGGVYRRYAGHVTIAERLASFEQICGDARFAGLRYAITDYLDVVSYEISSEATEQIAAFHVAPLAANPRLVMAAVATRPDIVAAIREFMAYDYTSAPYRIFDSEGAAREWVASLAQTSAPVPACGPGAGGLGPTVGDAWTDGALQPHEALALAQMSMQQVAALDERLLGLVPADWCPAALVIARALRGHAPLSPNGCAERLMELADRGAIEVQGDLRLSRRCRVRRASDGRPSP